MTAAHRPSVLFLCTHNAGRSQMATGFCRDDIARRVRVLLGELRLGSTD